MSNEVRTQSVSWLLASAVLIAGAGASCMLVTGVNDLEKGQCEGDCEDASIQSDGSISDAKPETSAPKDGSVGDVSAETGDSGVTDASLDSSDAVSDAFGDTEAGGPVACTSSSAECPNCVDGFCCDEPCGGGATDDCQACSKAAGAAFDGKCSALKGGTLCRPKSGDCDIADECDGTSVTCPNVFDSTTVCRPASGDCDIADKCDGAGPDCPSNEVKDQGVSCRASTGPCDVEEKCDGANAGCPIDGFVKAGTACGAAAGCSSRIESKAATCTGDQGICPASVRDCAPYDCGTGGVCETSCGSAGDCTLASACTGNACAASCPAGTSFVPGGLFFMGRGNKTDACPAGMTCGADELPEHGSWVSPYCLDTNEVTVARFRSFYEDYKAATKPTVGAGAKPGIQGSGWMAEWTALLPADQAALNQDLSCTNGTWSATAGVNDNLPITCVDWYTAFAFCVWEQKRLPTESEWEYASAGGSENRLYPWGAAAPTSNLAVYAKAITAPIFAVGSAPAGAGKWGHKDLAGSVWEWVLDYRLAGGYSMHLAGNCSEPGKDCASLVPEANGYRTMRGGAFNSLADSLRGAYRSNFDPSKSLRNIGFRCAKSL